MEGLEQVGQGSQGLMNTGSAGGSGNPQEDLTDQGPTQDQYDQLTGCPRT